MNSWIYTYLMDFNSLQLILFKLKSYHFLLVVGSQSPFDMPLVVFDSFIVARNWFMWLWTPLGKLKSVSQVLGEGRLEYSATY